MSFLLLKAASERVPREGGGWIEPGETARVQESYYYRQRLAEGSLVRIFDSEQAQAEGAVPVDVSHLTPPQASDADPVVVSAPESSAARSARSSSSPSESKR